MNNRELTYYSLLSRAEMRQIEELADDTPQETFIALGFEKKHFHHLWIGPNNEAFISTVSFITDLKKLNTLLTTQLKRYNKKDNLNINSNKDWLKHTKFIFQDEYNKTKKEIFSEVVEWCVEHLNDTKSNPVNNENKPSTIFNKADPDSHLFFDGFKKIGWIDKFEKENNIIINPTHSFELLKERRLRFFEQEKQNFIEERNIKELETSAKEMDFFYKIWLQSELDVIDERFEIKLESVSNQIEINKYRLFLKDEIQNVTQYYNVEKINTGYVNKYLEINEAMFHEHLKVFDSNQEPNQVTINLLLKQEHEYYKGFTNEWQDKLLDLIEKKQDIHPYLRKIYVNGFMKIKCDAMRYDNKVNTIPINEAHIDFLNFIHGVGLICQNIREYLILNFKLEIPLVSDDGYNITGGYFKEFKVLSVTNQNPLPKEKKDNIQELPLAEFIALISDLKLLQKYTITIGREEIAEGTIKELKATFKGVDMPKINRIIRDIEEKAMHNYSSIEVHNYFKKLTNDFQLSEMQIVLNDMIAFRDIEFFEDLDVLTMKKYRNEGWDIPTCEYESRRTGKISIITDTKKMRRRVFPLLGMLFFEAIYLLESKINDLKNKETEKSNTNESSTLKTKSDQLKLALSQYSFFELPKLKALNQEKQTQLVTLISSKSTPYQIAMFEHLDFITYLHEHYFKTKKKLYTGIATILDANERTIKGNVFVLNPKSKENRNRYTAHNYKEKAETDYHQLK
jgi:hypothetical protein